jgi:excisionase family DNA binding protein
LARTTKKSTARTRKPFPSVTPEVSVQPAVMTRTEAARYLHISVHQLVRLVHAGHVAEIAMNHVTRRYRKQDLDAFIVACSEKEAA